MKLQSWYLSFLLLVLLFAVGCAGPATPTGGPSAGNGAQDAIPVLAALDLQAGEKLRVVATTTLVADVVVRIGGDAIEVRALLPVGADPHGYQATPDDLRAISDAHLLFINGLGLEESLGSILDEARDRTVPVNVGVETLAFGEEHQDGDGEEHQDGDGEEHQDGDGEEHQDGDGEEHQGSVDPHTWWSVAAVEQWTRNIEQSLAAVDPIHASQYAANATAYRAELSALKTELEELVSQIPVTERKLATDHDALAYFAHDFGFRVVGLVVPSLSTLAEPSAKHLAALQDQIRAEDVQVIFVGSTVSPRQAEQLAQDIGIRVVPIFADSLSAADGPAPDYLAFMRYNVGAIVEALKP